MANNPTIEGTNFNASEVLKFKTAKAFSESELFANVFINYSKEDRLALMHKVYDECVSLNKVK